MSAGEAATELRGSGARLSGAVLAGAAILALAGYIGVYTAGRAGPPIRSDGFSYYVYLPAWFIFHDPSLGALARDCCGGEFPSYSAIIRWPGTRRWVNPHPIGVALMQAPFFAAAHAMTRWTNLSPDGFTLYYQHAAGLSGLGWMLAGLAILRRLLLRHFTDNITAAALATTLLGTNLFHYGTYDSAYSHAYSFCLFAAFLALTEHWHERPGPARSAGLGAVAGLVVLTRHTNALFLLAFPLYGVVDCASLVDRGRRMNREWKNVALMALAAAAVVSPQLAIYYRATGRPIVSAYGTLGFHWRDPHLFGVLFGVQKGLFFWSPLLLAACAGLAWLWRTRHPARALIPGSAIFLALNTYVIASWWDWQFGGSFGHRGFTDALPVFAVGFAGVYTAAARSRSRSPLPAAALAVVAALGVGLSVLQMLQYWNGVLPISDTTWDQYITLFLRLHR